MAESRVESVPTPDGAFGLPLWLPPAGRGPGLLLIQEIYGVSDYIQAVAGDLAGLGYLVAAPDLFWRIKPHHEAAHDQAGLAESLALGQQFDAAQGVRDCLTALRALASLPERDGGLGVIGFCLGGSIGYLVAAQAPVDVLLSFYGSAVPDSLDLLSQISAPASPAVVHRLVEGDLIQRPCWLGHPAVLPVQQADSLRRGQHQAGRPAPAGHIGQRRDEGIIIPADQRAVGRQLPREPLIQGTVGRDEPGQPAAPLGWPQPS